MFHGCFGNCVRSHRLEDSSGDRLGSEVMEKIKIFWFFSFYFLISFYFLFFFFKRRCLLNGLVLLTRVCLVFLNTGSYFGLVSSPHPPPIRIPTKQKQA